MAAAGGTPAPGEGWPGAEPGFLELLHARVKLAERRTVQDRFVIRRSLRTTPVFIHPDGPARKLLLNSAGEEIP